jgi:hypothetical protein
MRSAHSFAMFSTRSCRLARKSFRECVKPYRAAAKAATTVANELGAGRYVIGHAADDADRQHGRTRGRGGTDTI